MRMITFVEQFAEMTSDKIEAANRCLEAKLRAAAPKGRTGATAASIRVRTLSTSTPERWEAAAWTTSQDRKARFGKGTARGPARFTTVGDVTNKSKKSPHQGWWDNNIDAWLDCLRAQY